MLERCSSSHAALRVRVREVRTPVREDPEILGSARRYVSEMRRRRAQAAVVAGVSVQGDGVVRARLREEGPTGTEGNKTHARVGENRAGEGRLSAVDPRQDRNEVRRLA